MDNVVKRPLYRIAGEAEFIVVNDNGRIARAYFVSTAPVRGFEKLVVGKNPLFVIEAVMRICGLCHAAHAIASAEAFEHALGIMPPRDGLILREMIGLANRIQSHIYHLALILKDTVKAKYYSEMLFKTLNVGEQASQILSRLGGTSTHPKNIAIGGAHEAPKPAMMNDVRRRLDVLSKTYPGLMEEVLDEDKISEKALILRKYSAHTSKLASHLFYGSRFNLEVDKIKIIHPIDYYKNDGGLAAEVARKTTTMIAVYDDQIVEVGPRSRLETYIYFKDDSLLGLQVARLREIEIVLHRLRELIDQLNPNAPVRSGEIVYRRGSGIGVYEAPRGTLLHMVDLDDEGRVKNYKIIVPTMFNIPVMEKSAINLPVDLATTIPRLFDPCIPCTTHIVNIDKLD